MKWWTCADEEVACSVRDRKKMNSIFKDLCILLIMANVQNFECTRCARKPKFTTLGWRTSLTVPTPEERPVAIYLENRYDDQPMEEDIPRNEDFDGGGDDADESNSVVNEDNFLDQVPDKLSQMYANFRHSLAMFYLKLEAVHLIPAETVQKISDGIKELSELSLGISKEVILKELSSFNLAPEDSDRIIGNILSSDAIYAIHHKDVAGPTLSTKALRKTYYRENYRYIKPREINLSKDPRNKRCMYYVPIKKSLELSLENPEVKKEVAASFTRESEDGILKDYTDGSLYKKKKELSNNEKTIDILFFQDGFLPLKALSSVSNDYQMLGMYMVIGNLRPHLRSKVKCIQLVALVPDFSNMFKDFKLKCFKKIFDDLKKLEESGILFMGEQIKVELRFVIGDNKGQHEIGGFIKSFTHEYFCRYCPMTKTDINLSPWKVGPLRTREEYEAYSQMIRPDRETYKGISKPAWLCPFNKLANFHVCDPSLCPCCGHDLFQGVIDYDLALMIQHFVERGWFSYAQLNSRIKKFRYVGQDSGNKPAPVKPSSVKDDGTPNSPKLGGHAVQNWTLLRLLPFIIEDRIIDKEDEFWQLFLLLKAITDLICAPSITLTQVSCLKVMLEEYAFKRKELVGNGKPKHHYVYHYADLTTIMGPLIHVMTLRFEHFHQFFIRLAERSHNFINIGLSSVKKYCMFLAYLNAGSPFVSGIQILETGLPIYIKLATNQEQSYNHAIASRQISDQAFVMEKIVVDEVIYRKDQWLLLGNHSDTEIVIAKINSIVLDGAVVYLVVREHLATIISQLGIYSVNAQSLGLSCIPEKDIKYPISQSLYEWGDDSQCFSLKFTLAYDAVDNGRLVNVKWFNKRYQQTSTGVFAGSYL
ncbi:hypothetical protein FOCC_FOCC003531 [Frankliniella occidentalis]|nr:hypothetical protein FOCC_FOCC003531 [Frankliniella occidentalis]